MRARNAGRAEQLDLLRLPDFADATSLTAALKDALAQTDSLRTRGPEHSEPEEAPHVYGVVVKIHFTPGKPLLQAGQETQLQRLADALNELLRNRSAPKPLIEVWGPQDRGQGCTGTDGDALSKKRAENLVAALAMREVPRWLLRSSDQRWIVCSSSSGDGIEPDEAIVVLRFG